MPFDIEGARKEGYSDAEIADFLGKSSGFNTAGARGEGYSDAEIIGHLTKPASPAPQGPRAAATTAKPVGIEPPNAFENLLAKLPSSLADADPRGSAAGSAAHGYIKPFVGAGQAIANLLPDSTGIPQFVNDKVAESERGFQQSRAGHGRDGFDVPEFITEAGTTLAASRFVPGLNAMPKSMLGRMAVGGANGAFSGILSPVTDSGSFWSDKAERVAASGATGMAAVPVLDGLSRLVSPLASANQKVRELINSGVSPTIGQTLGGWANRVEEKAQSLPIVGDAIMSARQAARDQFNNATINKAVEPLFGNRPGQTLPVPAGATAARIEGAGHDAVRAAGDMISDAYKKASAMVKSVPLDGQFQSELAQLRQMAGQLTAPMRRKFEQVVNDSLLGRVSQTGHVLGDTFKTIDSDLGKVATRYSGSSVAAEQELGDALKQLQANFRGAATRANPAYAEALSRADEAWARLVRVEGAAGSAKLTDGVFTPGQLLGAVKKADTSVRDRATARGTALMQGWAQDAQQVLGNKYPDSGTAGRMMLGLSGLASGAVNPAIPAGLLAGAGGYSQAGQKLLRALVMNRPAGASSLGDAIRRAAPALPAALAPLLNASVQGGAVHVE